MVSLCTHSPSLNMYLHLHVHVHVHVLVYIQKPMNISVGRVSYYQYTPIKMHLIHFSRKKQQRQLEKQQQENGIGSVSPTAEVNSISSSRASRPWIKDPKADATPITDPKLREKLPTTRGSRISTKVRFCLFY